MLVLCDDPDQLPPSSSGEQIRRIREVAMVLGCAVYTIPPDFERCETGEAALWHVPSRSATEVAVWAGYVPSRERYKEIYDAALAKNIKLVNDPEQHRMAMELDVAYPFLEGLTPESLTLRSPAECAAAGDRLGYPIFVKGAVQSRKRQGWNFCVAEDRESLERLTALLLPLREGSRGRVIARRYVRLRYQRTTAEGMPMGREYRFFIWRGAILECGHYWGVPDPFGSLTGDERMSAYDLATRAVARLPVPYVALDVGQRETGEWIVIEANDAQFSGLGAIPVLSLWSKLATCR